MVLLFILNTFTINAICYILSTSNCRERRAAIRNVNQLLIYHTRCAGRCEVEPSFLRGTSAFFVIRDGGVYIY